MIEIQNRGDCSGCAACAAACPRQAIEMNADQEGFLYPVINSAKCIDCGICDNMCQAKNMIKRKREPLAYACWNKNDSVRMCSSSGGVFYVLAEFIIAHGGVVFGAAFDEELMVRHVAVDSMDQVYRLQGSKYVQSIIGRTYIEAKKLLDEGRYVLFTGTPCQIDGLLHYLCHDYELLYTQDIICHGVPSPIVWKRYLNYQEQQYKKPLVREPLPSFRRKEEGWKRYSISLSFDKDIEYRKYHKEDCYMQAFKKNLSLRPSCYECHSKTKIRNSDITLADFWGIEHMLPEMFDNKGTSLVLTNSEKGKHLFELLKSRLHWREVDFEEAVSHNTPAFQSVARPKKREAFYDRLGTMPFDRLVKRAILPPIYKRIYWKIRHVVGLILRKGKMIKS